jgi:hypothetical protein
MFTASIILINKTCLFKKTFHATFRDAKQVDINVKSFFLITDFTRSCIKYGNMCCHVLARHRFISDCKTALRSSQYVICQQTQPLVSAMSRSYEICDTQKIPDVYTVHIQTQMLNRDWFIHRASWLTHRYF